MEYLCSKDFITATYMNMSSKIPFKYIILTFICLKRIITFMCLIRQILVNDIILHDIEILILLKTGHDTHKRISTNYYIVTIYKGDILSLLNI